MTRVMRVFVVSVMSLACMWAQADANKSQISGTVTDPNDAAVAGAKVTVRNTGTGLVREIKSNDVGLYRALLLDPGTYDLTVEAPGFAATKISGLVLTVGSAPTVNVVVSVQAVATTVDVGETLINLEASTASTTVNATALAGLPINGRRFQDFALLTPTAQTDSQTRGQISFAGQRGIYSNVMLDGADYNQPFFGGIRGGERSGSIITVPQAAIQEFQVVTTGYTAEYGRSTGGIMNTITKSGTNAIHGEGFWQIRPRELSKNSPIPVLPPGATNEIFLAPSESLQQYGGGVGGPIKKDRLFYFGAVETQQAKTPRQVVFPQLAAATSNADTQAALAFYRGLEGPFEQSNRATAMTSKADYQFTNGDRLTFRYNYSRSNEVNAVTVGGAINPYTNNAVSNEGTEKDSIHNGTLQYTKLLSSNMVNDFRFTGSAEERPRLANSLTPTLSTTIGAAGTRSFLPTVQNDSRYQISDSMSITKGKHTVKIGFDINRIRAAQFFAFNQFGAFNVTGSNINAVLAHIGANGTNGVNRFDAATTGTSAPAVFTTYTRQIGNGLADYGMKQYAIFAQDNFKVTRKLSIDLGFRWEGQDNPASVADNATVLARINGVTFPNGGKPDVGNIKDSMKQFMPRFGFAYAPIADSRRLVIRGFTGIFYASTPLLSFSGPYNNFRAIPGDVSTSVGGGTNTLSVFEAFRQAGVNLNSSSLSSLPAIPLDVVQRAAAIALGGTARDPFVGANFTGMAPNFENPRAVQAGLGFESELVKNFVVGMQFNYVNTVHLIRNRDWNLFAPTLRAGDLSLRPRFVTGNGRPVPTVGTLTMRESSARGMYRATTFQAQYRKRKFQFQGFYTVAYNFSDDDNERDTGFSTASGYENAFNFKQDYGYAAIDIRHQLTMNSTYDLPFGITVGGIFRARSGLPINPRVGTDVNSDGVNSDRPFQRPGQIFARNFFRNRGTSQLDMRVMKSFTFRERLKLQASAEIFNLMNADNVVFGSNALIYGEGFGTAGAVPIDARFMRLRNPANGNYDRNNVQVGNPLQAQFGVRAFF
jgi:hypothetical protein